MAPWAVVLLSVLGWYTFAVPAVRWTAYGRIADGRDGTDPVGRVLLWLFSPVAVPAWACGWAVAVPGAWFGRVALTPKGGGG